MCFLISLNYFTDIVTMFTYKCNRFNNSWSLIYRTTTKKHLIVTKLRLLAFIDMRNFNVKTIINSYEH